MSLWVKSVGSGNFKLTGQSFHQWSHLPGLVNLVCRLLADTPLKIHSPRNVPINVVMCFFRLKGQERPRIIFNSIRWLHVIWKSSIGTRWLAGADRQAGLEVRIDSTRLSPLLLVEHRSWRLSIFIAQVWRGFIKLSVLSFPLCRVLTRLMRNCLNCEKLHTLFIGLRLVISIFRRAWVFLPAHSIQTHQNKDWKCYHNQSNNHRQNNTRIRGAGWRACISSILNALKM